MTQKFYVDAQGRFLGSFDGSEPGNLAAVEVPSASENSQQVWKDGKWGAVPTVLQNITARQLRLALSKNGLLARVEPALKAIPDTMARETALIEWEYATEYRPDHVLIGVMKASLGITSEQFRTMWLEAMKL